MIKTSGPIQYGDGFKYQLKRGWWCQTPLVGCSARIEDPDSNSPWVRLDNDGTLHIRAGYAWDGASGPTWDTKSSMRGSLAHDALYQLERAGKLPQEWRLQADEILRDICKQDGMLWLRFKAWFLGVRFGAAYAAKRQPERILTAP